MRLRPNRLQCLFTPINGARQAGFVRTLCGSQAGSGSLKQIGAQTQSTGQQAELANCPRA